MSDLKHDPHCGFGDSVSVSGLVVPPGPSRASTIDPSDYKFATISICFFIGSTAASEPTQVLSDERPGVESRRSLVSVQRGADALHDRVSNYKTAIQREPTTITHMGNFVRFALEHLFSPGPCF